MHAGILPVDNSEYPVNEQPSPFVRFVVLRCRNYQSYCASAPILRPSFLNENVETCRSNVWFFLGAPRKRVCAFQICSDGVAEARNPKQIPMHSAAGHLVFGPTETFFCHQAMSEKRRPGYECAAGLSHREATAPDLPLHCLPILSTPMSLFIGDQHASRQRAGERVQALQQWTLDLAEKEIDPDASTREWKKGRYSRRNRRK